MDASRREFIRRVLAASALVGVGGVAIWDLIEGGSNATGQQSVTLLQTSTTQQSSSSGSAQSAQSTPAGYVFVTGLAALSGKSSAYFNHPTGGLSLLLSLNSQWKAFSATCTHAPCTVAYAGSQVQCPCHGAVFDPSNGNVLAGPAPIRLPQYDVLVQGNSLYVSNRIIN
ncbi:MAG TPA: Rieske (2Fe-2S) protein [Nitrososphaerales archaeon]|nr:Rieske (2Fe-2S) protein [Nitrososphaerales archaeon]